MNRQQRALELFDQAVEQPDPHAWLEQQCADDSALRQTVQALLTADRRATRFLAAPIRLETVPRDGQQIGDYRLLRRLGEGGMGAVYLAESQRLNGQKVALKLLRFDAPDLRERFALEQRILGGLEHPAIARLLDVGTAADGAPFFVMEYVAGQTLLEHAAWRDLGVRARLKLMIQVLAAVQYAHGQLVLHRDFKPSNILVNEAGQPKLLDFGIAKLIGDRAAQAPELTGTGLGPMTMEYASPEQVCGRPLDTSSDTYSLGMVLYELLTGARPYALDGASPSEVERRICTQVPRRPSLVNPRLPRDLDPVLGKALAKEPPLRYRSAAEFAEDLERVLDGLPVRARAPTLSYRALRFVGRHRWGLAATVLVMLALGATTAIAVRNAAEARRAFAEARRERDTAREIQGWLERMLANADPRVIGHAPTAGELLDGAAASLAGELHARPGIERSLRLTLAVAYRGLGHADAALRESARALALLDGETPALERSQALRVRAQTLSEQSDYAGALQHVELALAALPDTAATEVRLERTRGLALQGFLLSRQGASDAAASILQRAITAYAALGEPWGNEHAEALNNLAVLEGSRGRWDRALALHQQADALYANALGDDHVTTLLSQVNTASAQESLGDIGGAEARYRALLPRLEQKLGRPHADVVRIRSTLGYLLANHGKADVAVQLMRDTVTDARTGLSADNPMRIYAETVYGGALLEAGQPDEAQGPLRTAHQARVASLPAGHPLLLSSECALLEAQARSGEAAARRRIQALLEASAATLGTEHPLVVRCARRLAVLSAAP